MFPRGVGVERWVTYFFPENQALMVFNSIWVPSVSPFTLNPCSKSTIQMKVAVRKARVQRTLETMRMPEKRADFMGKRAEMSSTHFKQAKCVPQAHSPVSDPAEVSRSKTVAHLRSNPISGHNKSPK
jgi:hypothetical protein